jgi:transcriptional regulator of acetoin/glycerol metabolism
VLLRHAWPGNVRELENTIASAALVAPGEFIDAPDLPDHLQRPAEREGAGELWRPLPLEEVRKEHIQRMLKLCGGNRVRTAQLLGIGRTSLYRHLKRQAGASPSRTNGSGRAQPVAVAD